MALFKLDGIAGLKDKVQKSQQRVRNKAAAKRKEIATFFVKALSENTPVWSGATLGSVRVNSNGSKARLKEKPEPGGREKYGQTGSMALGVEPMRASALARALSAVEGADYNIQKPIRITINSEVWSLINRAAAPLPSRARNVAVVEEIARTRTKDAFRDSLK
jgi:hypothetical protein